MIFTFEKNFKISQVIRGGARETHWVTCHNGLNPKKIKEFLKSPLRFLDLNQSSYGFSSMFSDEHFVSSHKLDSSLFPLFCSSLSILLLKTSFNIIVKILNKFVNKVYNLMMKLVNKNTYSETSSSTAVNGFKGSLLFGISSVITELLVGLSNLRDQKSY